MYSYSNNDEYRATIRSYFHMNTQDLEQKYAHLKEQDPESYDELLYDDDAMKKGIDTIFNKTKDDPRFVELYLLAAAHFISQELETGLCVLLTYDYFASFIAFYENPTQDAFLSLRKRL